MILELFRLVTLSYKANTAATITTSTDTKVEIALLGAIVALVLVPFVGTGVGAAVTGAFVAVEAGVTAGRAVGEPVVALGATVGAVLATTWFLATVADCVAAF